MPPRLAEALELIDSENQADPSVVRFEGKDRPVALIEGIRAHYWAQHLTSNAPDELLIAARAHHLRRWEIPRNAYPRTREGYLAWRNRLYGFHAEAVAKVMRRAGYTEAAVTHVGRLLRKEAIKADSDAQTYEDAVSLAFLEVRLASFMESVTEQQLARALRQTWRKMSEAGHEAALTLSLEPRVKEALLQTLTRR